MREMGVDGELGVLSCESSPFGEGQRASNLGPRFRVKIRSVARHVAWKEWPVWETYGHVGGGVGRPAASTKGASTTDCPWHPRVPLADASGWCGRGRQSGFFSLCVGRAGMLGSG
jgi:hypothetical protein